MTACMNLLLLASAGVFCISKHWSLPFFVPNRQINKSINSLSLSLFLSLPRLLCHATLHHLTSSPSYSSPESQEPGASSYFPSFLCLPNPISLPMTFQMEYSTLWFLVTALLLSIWLLRRHSSSCSTLKHIPTVSYSPYLPAFINRLIYYPDAASLIYRGYKQVCTTSTLSGRVMLTPQAVQGLSLPLAHGRWRCHRFAREIPR